MCARHRKSCLDSMGDGVDEKCVNCRADGSIPVMMRLIVADLPEVCMPWMISRSDRCDSA